jgi:hypothetical protein
LQKLVHSKSNLPSAVKEVLEVMAGKDWFSARLDLKLPIRVFGACDHAAQWYSQANNGSFLRGQGPALLKDGF